MDKILHIGDRLESKKRRRQAEAFRNRIQAIQSVVRCSSCRLKCVMCGRQVDTDRTCACAPVSSCSDFNLCASCRTEYRDFLDIANGRKGAEVFWHNSEWLNLWSAWVAYQKAIREFRNSPEFKQLDTEDEN